MVMFFTSRAVSGSPMLVWLIAQEMKFHSVRSGPSCKSKLGVVGVAQVVGFVELSVQSALH